MSDQVIDPGTAPARPEGPAEGRHLLGWIARGTEPRMRRVRLALAAAGILLGLVAVRAPLDSLQSPTIYRKDFMQEYLLARAVADGVNPYVTVRELATRYLGHVPPLNAAWPHPTPHPPPVGLLFLPLAYLGFDTGAALWLSLELLFLLSAVALLGRTRMRSISKPAVLVVAAALIAWSPFNTALFYGQLTVIILLLLAGARTALLAGRSGAAGLLLGLAVLIKPVPLPLILLLAIRRQWRACGIATATVAIGYGASAAILGPNVIVDYVSSLPAVGDSYRGSSWNISLWTIGWRVFDGTGSAVLPGLLAAPLLKSGLAARLLSIALPSLFLLASLILARKARSLDAAFCAFICVSILVSPTAWSHYLAFATIPAARIIGLLGENRFPVGETNLMLGLAALLAVSDGAWAVWAVTLSGRTLNEAATMIPFWPSLLTLMPAVGVMLLGWTALRWRASEQGA